MKKDVKINSNLLVSPYTMIKNNKSNIVENNIEENKNDKPKKRKEENKRINIVIPVSIYDNSKILCIMYGKGNITKYINDLLAKNIEENKDALEMYKELQSKLNNE